MSDYIVYTKAGACVVSAQVHEVRNGALVLSNFLRSEPKDIAIFAPGEWVRCDIEDLPKFDPGQIATEYFKDKD